MKKILFYWGELKSTFWFLPVVFILLAIVFALLFAYFDSQVQFPDKGIWPYILVGSASSARTILATISAAMIGVAGTVFSITLVALTLASSQFGPRLIRNFMYDRFNQVVLGTYIATFIYCLMVLNTIKETDHLIYIPSLSILFAIIAAVANIILLVIFIHHISVSIQADKVISDISESMSKNISSLFPDTLDDVKSKRPHYDEKALKNACTTKQTILAAKSGYLQYIDNDALVALALDYDFLIHLNCRAGDYLVKESELGTVYAGKNIEDEQIKKISHQLIIGQTRTRQQDAEHAIHQMVEIAARALSPGVNDPYTAIACIDNLTSTMCYLSRVKFPSKHRTDKDKRLRLIVETFSFNGMLNAAFNQIRQYAKGSPSVVIRLMDALITIDQFTHKPDYKISLKKHAEMIMNMAKESFTEPNDIKDVKERYALIVKD
ncbi:Uncharacterized membrane protein [Saccharicrinis carchari]|uniref:Uncharacterized membrane protein n=1 Tax=Saccharicrinis carchari TaxID=1168039 RepID=A0A521EUB9_SACCC|nr:DUF2254 domain-containing protein [Saccharicrinis carchari]SMO87495.1 Uncharacterized membrane protein [Saccharicrinis carchari]